MTAKLLPAPTRFVTGHDEQGKAIIKYEDEIPFTAFAEAARFGVPWQTTTFPVDNADETDKVTLGGPLNNDSGTILRIVDIAPGSISPMHRTVSLDYGIVTKGEVTLELDDGLKRTLQPGDICVQRGTIHAWHNPSDEWARVVFVLVAAKPLEIAGKELGYVFPGEHQID